MQGRLVPPEAGRFQCFPVKRWRSEFALAAQAGLDAIEWIFDQYGESSNPLGSAGGIAEMLSMAKLHGVGVYSVCADYFMDRPLLRASGAEYAEICDMLAWLLHQCQRAGIERMVLPFVDQSKIQNSADSTRLVELLRAILPEAERCGVELHLETSLAPAPFAALLDHLPHAWLKVNYDSGNSSSLGYDSREEFAAYGKRIASVHLKDRVLGGGTVPLGTGDADLKAVFYGLENIGYCGDYVLQVDREKPGNEVAWTRQNRNCLLELLGASAPKACGGTR
jgi:L-ribulose-5-phosphate 3-epimerase